PVYTPFYNVIEQHDRKVVKNPLVNKDNYYTIDFADFEDQLKQGVKAFILCSPHNPVGRVWTKDELQEMARLCLQYDVLILSEEIADKTVTFMSPSKTFNLAGLQASYIITTNKTKREQLDAAFKIQGLNALNTMGSTALEAAYKHGEAWLDELIDVLNDHQNY